MAWINVFANRDFEDPRVTQSNTPTPKISNSLNIEKYHHYYHNIHNILLERVRNS